MAQQDDVKKDLAVIQKIHSKLDYSNLIQVAAIKDKLDSNGTLITLMGRAYTAKLGEILNDSNEGDCIFCHRFFGPEMVICDECAEKIARLVGKKEEKPAPKTEAKPEPVMEAEPATTIEPEPASEIPAKSETPKKAENDAIHNILSKTGDVTKKAIGGVATKVNKLAGGRDEKIESGDLKFKDFFVNVFKKHSRGEMEEIFTCGTLKTTPSPDEIASEWPKPWLYSRVLLILLAALVLLMVCWTAFQNINVIPDIIFIGSCVMPISIVIFFFEINAPRNISLITVLKVFFIGGAASLVVTLTLFDAVEVGELDYGGAILVGLIEEIGKVVIVAFALSMTKQTKYIFNGILVGGAVGAGFAVFESAGYAFRAWFSYFGQAAAFDGMVNNILLRGVLAPGGHVAWAAINGAGIVLAIKEYERLQRKDTTRTEKNIDAGSSVKNIGNAKTTSNAAATQKAFFSFPVKALFNRQFLSLFAITVVLHALWDCPLTIFGSAIPKIVVLIILAWIVLMVLIHNALEEVNHKIKK